MGAYVEREIVEKTDLCSGDGTLNPVCTGWARHPVINCNLKGRWPRKKKWNYWCVMSEECLFSATVSNIDYAGMAFVYFLDYNTKKFVEKTVITPFGTGCAMPAGVLEDVRFKNRQLEIAFQNDGGETRLVVKSGDFGGESLEADVLVHYPAGYETLNVVVPWNNRTFQYTSKHEGMSASGLIKVGDKTYDLNTNTYGCLDFGRGIWPYRVSWNWAAAGGFSKGRRLGLNLGGQWTDNTGMNENAVVVGGKLTKISEDMIFDYDKNNFMTPWRIRTGSGRIDLVMTPFFERVAKSDLGIVVSEVHQMVGRFSGRITMPDGEIIDIENLVGTAEDHYGKW